jgi:hypothetical protein
MWLIAIKRARAYKEFECSTYKQKRIIFFKNVLSEFPLSPQVTLSRVIESHNFTLINVNGF